jgi:hypothetical protein
VARYCCRRKFDSLILMSNFKQVRTRYCDDEMDSMMRRLRITCSWSNACKSGVRKRSRMSCMMNASLIDSVQFYMNDWIIYKTKLTERAAKTKVSNSSGSQRVYRVPRCTAARSNLNDALARVGEHYAIEAVNMSINSGHRRPWKNCLSVRLCFDKSHLVRG